MGNRAPRERLVPAEVSIGRVFGPPATHSAKPPRPKTPPLGVTVREVEGGLSRRGVALRQGGGGRYSRSGVAGGGPLSENGVAPLDAALAGTIRRTGGGPRHSWASLLLDDLLVAPFVEPMKRGALGGAASCVCRRANGEEVTEARGNRGHHLEVRGVDI